MVCSLEGVALGNSQLRCYSLPTVCDLACNLHMYTCSANIFVPYNSTVVQSECVCEQPFAVCILLGPGFISHVTKE